MRRYPPPSAMSASFGPGPMTPAVKWLLISNIAIFLITSFWPDPVRVLGLRPLEVWGGLRVWQVATYMFLHANLLHVGFNMLALWMFGVELERLWGTRFFVRYYAITGVGAGLCVMLVSVFSTQLAQAATIGASGAIFGLLMAYALYFPHRQILLFLLFPVSSRVFVAIVGRGEPVFSHDRHQRRRRLFRAPGRPRRRVPLSEIEDAALPSHRGNQVSLPEMEDQPREAQVRRLCRGTGG